MKQPPQPSGELGEADGLGATNDAGSSQHDVLLRWCSARGARDRDSRARQVTPLGNRAAISRRGDASGNEARWNAYHMWGELPPAACGSPACGAAIAVGRSRRLGPWSAQGRRTVGRLARGEGALDTA